MFGGLIDRVSLLMVFEFSGDNFSLLFLFSASIVSSLYHNEVTLS